MTTFLDFARSHGLILSHAIADGAWHRVPTEDHPRKRNGAYAWDGSHSGACQNWATMEQAAIWRERASLESPIVAGVFGHASKLYRKQAQERARNEAIRLLGSAERGLHPYLARKGFPLLQGLIDPVSGDLLIPMRDCRDYSVVNSVQRIGADGSKKFLYGGKAKGSIFRVGQGAPLWLCEGYATGATIAAALQSLHARGSVVITFSAGNLTWVAHQMSQRPAYVFADRDLSGAGEQAAKATGLPYCMSPVIGQDANDMHQEVGIRAVARLMLECMQREAVEGAPTALNGPVGDSTGGVAISGHPETGAYQKG